MPSVPSSSPRIVLSIPERPTANHINQMIARGFFSNLLVVTEEDYDTFLTRYPLLATYLANQLITKTAVFVGYSLDDPDFRQIWSIVSDRLGRTRRIAYSIMVAARSSDIARFERRGVKVINLPGTREKYAEALSETFNELREYRRDNVISVSHVTEEQSLREFLLPRDAQSRLCFFSIPVDMLSLYRSRVFPTVEDIGFVPITADEIISPGDNILAKIDAIISRATVMVIELGSRWTRAEFDMAVAQAKNMESAERRRRPLRIIVVTTSADKQPSLVGNFVVIERGSIVTEDTDPFVATLAEHLRKIANEVGLERDEEARRLFEAHEYRAAVISAMTLFEANLRRRIDMVGVDDAWRAQSLGRLVDLAVRRGLITWTDRQKVAEWMKIRNEAVHLARPVSRAMAREIVDGVLALSVFGLDNQQQM